MFNNLSSIIIYINVGGDIVWVDHPLVIVKEKKRGERRAVKSFRSRIPRILRSLAPTTVFDPHAAWKKQQETDNSLLAAVTKKNKKDEEIKEKLNAKRAEERYDLDKERIQSKAKEGGM